MPISFPSSLIQADRKNRVTGVSNFFHIVEAEDINYAVEKILKQGDLPLPNPQLGDKYLLFSVDTFQPENAMVYDIVMWDGTKWIVYLNVRNSKTPFGLVFDKETKKFYHYVDTQAGWLPLLRSGSVDGGTFD